MILLISRFETRGNRFRASVPEHAVGLPQEEIDRQNAIKQKRNNNSASKPKRDPQTAKLVEEMRRLQAGEASGQAKPLSAIQQLEKQLRKQTEKLAAIDKLQARIDSGELAQPEKNQVEKLNKRPEVEQAIADLKLQIEAAS